MHSQYLTQCCITITSPSVDEKLNSIKIQTSQKMNLQLPSASVSGYMCLNPDCHVYKEQPKKSSLTWDLFDSISFPRYILWSKLHIWSGISQIQCDRCETYWSVTSYAGNKKDSACNLEKDRMKFYIHFYAKQVPLVWKEPRYSALFINLSDKLIAWRR